MIKISVFVVLTIIEQIKTTEEVGNRGKNMLRNKDTSYNFLYSTSSTKTENNEKFPSFPSSFNVIKELHNTQPYENAVDFDSMEKSNEVSTIPLLLKSSNLHQHYTNYTTANWNIQPSFSNSWSNREENLMCYHSHNESADDEDTELENDIQTKFETAENNVLNSINMEFRNHDQDYQRQQSNNTLQLTGQQFALVSGLPTPTDSYTIVRNVENADEVTDYNLSDSKHLMCCDSNNTCSIVDERDLTADSFIETQLAETQKQNSLIQNTHVPKLLRPIESTQNSSRFNNYQNSCIGFSMENNEFFPGNNHVTASPSKESNNQWSLTSALDLYAYSATIENTAAMTTQNKKKKVEDSIQVSEYKKVSEPLTSPMLFSINDGNSHSIVRQLLEDPYLADIIDKPQKRGLYRCAHCPSTFSTIFEYASHLDEYRVERKYKCPFKRCAWRILGLPRRSDLRRHCAIQHKYELYKELKRDLNLSEDAYPSLICPVLFCQKEFYRRDAFKRHLSIVHQNENSRFNKRLKKISEECPLFATESEKISYIKDKMACKKTE